MNREPPFAAGEPTLPTAWPAGHRIGHLELLAPGLAGDAALVYRGWDHALARAVAIKAYFPVGMALRRSDGSLTVAEGEADAAARFERGRHAFIDESRTLARCDHRSLVRVLNLVEAHGTAFCVMPWYDGRPLPEVPLQRGGPIEEPVLRSLLDDLLGALEVYHRVGGLHGGLNPSKVLFLDEGRALLLGPGAATHAVRRRAGGDGLADRPEAGFAPLEQTHPSAALPQGPWTDFYALAAVARFCITGLLPPAAGLGVPEPLAATVERLFFDAPSVSYGPQLLRALEAAMSPDIGRRPQTVAQFRQFLLQTAQAAWAVPATPLFASTPGPAGPASNALPVALTGATAERADRPDLAVASPAPANGPRGRPGVGDPPSGPSAIERAALAAGWSPLPPPAAPGASAAAPSAAPAAAPTSTPARASPRSTVPAPPAPVAGPHPPSLTGPLEPAPQAPVVTFRPPPPVLSPPRPERQEPTLGTGSAPPGSAPDPVLEDDEPVDPATADLIRQVIDAIPDAVELTPRHRRQRGQTPRRGAGGGAAPGLMSPTFQMPLGASSASAGPPSLFGPTEGDSHDPAMAGADRNNEGLGGPAALSAWETARRTLRAGVAGLGSSLQQRLQPGTGPSAPLGPRLAWAAAAAAALALLIALAIWLWPHPDLVSADLPAVGFLKAPPSDVRPPPAGGGNSPGRREGPDRPDGTAVRDDLRAAVAPASRGEPGGVRDVGGPAPEPVATSGPASAAGGAVALAAVTGAAVASIAGLQATSAAAGAAPGTPPTSASTASTPPSRQPTRSAAVRRPAVDGRTRTVTPRQACGERSGSALNRCLRQQCGMQRWSRHPACQALRRSGSAR